MHPVTAVLHRRKKRLQLPSLFGLRKKHRKTVLPSRQLFAPHPKPAGFKRRIRESSLVLVLFVCIALLIYGVINFPFLQVTTIEQVGVYDNPAFSTDLQALKGKNLLFLNPKKLTESFARNYPETEGLTIARRIPSKIVVTFTKRIPVAIVIQSRRTVIESTPSAFVQASGSATRSATRIINQDTPGESYYVDVAGVPFAIFDPAGQGVLSVKSTDTQGTQLPTIAYISPYDLKIGEKPKSAFVSHAVKIAGLAHKKQLHFVKFTNEYQSSRSAIANEESYTGKLDDAIAVVFTTTKPVVEQLEALQTILLSSKIERRKITKIDVRFQKPVLTNK